MLHPELRAEALAWLDDCFPDVPADLTDTEIVNAIRRHYSGGWPAFLAA